MVREVTSIHSSDRATATPPTTKGRATQRLVSVGLVLVVLFWSSTSSAQTADTGFSVDRFESSPSQETAVLNVDRPAVLPHLTPSIGLQFDFADDPVQRVAKNDPDRVIDRLVDDRYDLEVGAGLGLFDVVEVGVVLPLTVAQTGTAVTGSTQALGDLRGKTKIALLHPDSTGGFGLALAGTLYIPTGSRAAFTSDGSVRGFPSLSLGWQAPGGAEVMANVGYEFRPELSLETYTAGGAMRWSAATRVPIPETPVAGFATVYGRQSLETGFSDRSDPVEVGGGARIDLPAHLRLQVGGAAGVTDGVGAPDFRIFAAVDWTRVRRDADDDGIPDRTDECPETPEDHDGYEDSDGCPDPDNDDDGIEDTPDECPDTPGPRSNDGCPVEDRDGDGIPDDDDECPDDPEDEDGFEDDDGCPDPDNDDDGILDENDECPDEPETRNGVDDEDGCPDQKETTAKVVEQEIEITEKIHFETEKAVIEKRSYNVLNDIVRILDKYEQITKVVIEGHTDSRGPKRYNEQLSAARANAVRQFLIERGIDSKRLQSVGLGASEPVETNDTAEGRAENRRVEFQITQIGGEPLEDGEPILRLSPDEIEDDEQEDDDSNSDDAESEGSASDGPDGDESDTDG